RREVNRIILTRPAVEAGERLGFLPGDLMAKVDPYLRPLFDALHDMLEPERVSQHLERGVIEVAPLAFMRGRAQPVSSGVLTPSGFRPIGSLRVGDLVTGSDGRPTPVLGVYPQGRKEVFRLTAQDGGSTLCCAEHLWHVSTSGERRRGKPGRILQTRDMIGRLRSLHEHHFELPLLQAPAELEPRDVPIDPYTLGLLLGDGGATGGAPAFAGDSEPITAADGSRDDIGLSAGTQLAVAVGTDQFVPEAYLDNAPVVRVGILQGLLDSDGGEVVRAGATCPIQFVTCSERLRDDVAYVVRSLGGVACWRRRETDGSAPALVDGGPVPPRADAFVLDIRLPAGIEPFRVARKRALYNRDDRTRPTRFVTAIEPAGDADCVCIQVAAADSLYVTDDFLVTHNTLNDSFIILDEAQNTSPEQMKMFLTRLGFNSRMVVTGDITQIDLPREQDSGLVVVADILDDIEGIEFVRFGEEDVVRHKLVRRIVAAYNEHGQRSAPELRQRKRA
ncbi:MAG: PhoH family protein, partial [Solirubrobacteraceae bacterium]